jgi:hypothetical protein
MESRFLSQIEWLSEKEKVHSCQLQHLTQQTNLQQKEILELKSRLDQEEHEYSLKMEGLQQKAAQSKRTKENETGSAHKIDTNDSVKIINLKYFVCY